MFEDSTRPPARTWRRRLLAAGLLAIVQALATPGCSDDPLSELLSQAEVALRADDARAAAVYYGTAAAKAPRDDFVRWQLAKVLLTVRDGAAAEKEIRTAAELGVDDERTRPALAEALFLQGRHQAVVDLPVDGLGKNAGAVVLAYQGLASIELGQIEAAERLYKKAEKLSRYSADVVFLEAELARLREDRTLTKEALNSVKLLEPDYPYAAARLGEIALAEGDPALAERFFSEALERRYGPWRDQLNRGIARLLQAKVDQALQDARELLASSAGHRDVHLFAYQVYATKGETEGAREALEQVLQRDPDHYRARYALARIELAEGRRERGESLVRSTHGLDPAFEPASRLLAALLLEQDRVVQALEVIGPAIEASPGDPQLQRMLAHAYLKQGRYEDLIGLADGLRGHMDPAGLPAFDRGIAQLEAGEFDAATATLAPAMAVGVRDLPVVDPLEIGLTTSPAAPPAELVAEASDLLRQAQRHLRNGEEEQAIERFERVLAEDPNNLEALEGMTVLSIRRDRDADIAVRVTEADEDRLDPPGRRLRAVDLAEVVGEVSTESPEEPATVVTLGQRKTGDLLALRDLDLDTTVAGEAPREDRLTSAELSDGAALPRVPDSELQLGHADTAAGGDQSVEAPADGTLAALTPMTTASGGSVETFVHDWAAAWSRQDVDAYLSHYADDFRPSRGVSRTDWEDQRRVRLTRPKEIFVRVSGIEVERLDERRVRARFEQVYRASHYEDRVTKTLELRLQNEDWKIFREFSR